MTSVVPKEGLDWYRDKSFNNVADTRPYIVAVGTGTTAVSSSDTSLDTFEYESNDDNGNCTVGPTSSVGEYEFKISVTGGMEVPADTDITEIGIKTDGANYFLYREVRSAVTVPSGERVTFTGTMDVQDGS